MKQFLKLQKLFLLLVICLTAAFRPLDAQDERKQRSGGVCPAVVGLSGLHRLSTCAEVELDAEEGDDQNADTDSYGMIETSRILQDDISDEKSGKGTGYDDDNISKLFNIFQGGDDLATSFFKGILNSFDSEGEDSKDSVKVYKTLSSLASQFVNGTVEDEHLQESVMQFQNLLFTNSSKIQNLVDANMIDPYMDIPEISMPAVAAEVYARIERSTPVSEEQKNTAWRPKEVILPRVNKFVEGSEEVFSQDQAVDGLCHLLVLSGGGARAAFQAGAITGLSEQYKAHGRRLHWDVVSGVGFGGIHAIISLFSEPGLNHELDYGYTLWKFWKTLRFENLMKCKDGFKSLTDVGATMQWIADGFQFWTGKTRKFPTGTSHSCDTTPLRDTLQKELQMHVRAAASTPSNSYTRVAILTAAKAGGGEHVFSFDALKIVNACRDTTKCEISSATAEPLNEALNALEATVATPGTFPLKQYIREEGLEEVLADGSLTSFLNFSRGVEKCRELIQNRTNNLYNDQDLAAGKGIVVDFILGSEVDKANFDDSLDEVFSGDEEVYDNSASPLENIEAMKEKFPSISIRHVIAVDEEPLDLAHEVMDLRSVNALLERGRVAGWKAATYKTISKADA